MYLTEWLKKHVPTKWKAKADLYEDMLEMVRSGSSIRRNRRNKSDIKRLSAFYTNIYLPNTNLPLQQMIAGITPYKYL